MKTAALLVAALLAVLIAGTGCEYRITPPDPNQGAPNTSIGDTNYVEVFPPWGGFASPRAMIVGNDQLLYVCDYAANEIVMLDAGGRILKRRSLLHPASIAQDSKLDLLVGGETVSGSDTVGTIFRISLVRWDTVYQAGISIDPITGDTTKIFRDTSIFYYGDLEAAHMRPVWRENGKPGRRFTGMGVLPPANEFIALRNGSDNTSFVDPDTRLLLFDAENRLETPIGDLVTRSSDATGITDIRDVTGLLIVPSSRDFVLTQSNLGNAYGAVWMVYISNADRQGWDPKFNPTDPLQRVDFTLRNRFVDAAGAAYDRRRRELFVVDAALDSVVKFDRTGRFRTESFGKFRTTSASFPGLSNPRGIAFANDGTLYITDTGNRVIRRFKLSGSF